jgi:polyisoprenoid-binding protein YceI
MTWRRWLLAGIVASGIVGVGGPFFFQHVVEGKAPAQLTLDSPAPAASSGTLVTNGTWRVAAGSIVGYRVNEVLLGQKNIAAGRTSSITGSIAVEGKTVRSGSFTVDMTTIRSNRSMRDNQFNGRVMQTSTYPMSTFAFADPIELGSIPASGVKKTLPAKGKLTLHGVTKTVSFNVTAVHTGSSVQVTGTIPIIFADWNIQDPNGGPAHTEDHGVLEFKLNFAHA